MRVVRDLFNEEIEVPQRLVVTVGVFDGVHVGHQQVIRAVVDWAREFAEAGKGELVSPGVVTFDPVPRQVLHPETAPELLTTTERKLELLAEIGIELAFLIVFDRALAGMSPQQFVETILVERLGVDAVVVGHDWRFGAGAAGDHDKIEELGKRYGFAVRQVDPFLVDGAPVSSTLVRAKIATGDLEAASRLLGRSYSLAGPVTRGSAVARELGFHTANIDTQGCLVPPDGIYAGLVRFDAGELPAALYIGTSPTIKDNPEQTVEVHILDYQGELYGRHLEVVILKKLRDERKFPDRESLKRQIAEDIEQTRRMTENGEGAA